MMNSVLIYALTGIGLFSLGLYALIVHNNLLRKILAVNVMGSGILLILVALAKRSSLLQADAVPQAMVITGIVVTVCATALALALMLKLTAKTGRADLPEQEG